MQRAFTSGDLARATGETVRTVRFYEEEGLLRPTTVSEGGHRRYDQAGLEQLQLILDLRELGLSIPDIRGLLAMREGCRTAIDFRRLLAERLPAHVARTRNRIERLRRIESELRQALEAVSDDAVDGSGEEVPCPCAVAAQRGAPRIVRVLARNGECGGGHPVRGPVGLRTARSGGAQHGHSDA